MIVHVYSTVQSSLRMLTSHCACSPLTAHARCSLRMTKSRHTTLTCTQHKYFIGRLMTLADYPQDPCYLWLVGELASCRPLLPSVLSSNLVVGLLLEMIFVTEYQGIVSCMFGSCVFSTKYIKKLIYPLKALLKQHRTQFVKVLAELKEVALKWEQNRHRPAARYRDK